MRRALALTDEALQQAPGDEGLRVLRADIHIALHHYAQALADYAPLPDAGLPAERKLMRCLLRERVQPAPLPLDCYADAGKRFAAGLAADLLAAMPAGPQREINIMLFQDFDRTRYLHSVLP